MKKLRRIFIGCVVLVTAIPTLTIAEDTLWSPTDFDGAWIHVNDNAKNGCWTNIGESKSYAGDQLELVGFAITDQPERNDDGVSPILAENHIALIIEVEATRWDNNLCVGHILTYFVGSVVPRKQQDIMIVNSIGYPDAWAIWGKNNLNNYVLDHIKNYVTKWVKTGEIERTVD